MGGWRAEVRLVLLIFLYRSAIAGRFLLTYGEPVEPLRMLFEHPGKSCRGSVLRVFSARKSVRHIGDTEAERNEEKKTAEESEKRIDGRLLHCPIVSRRNGAQ